MKITERTRVLLLTTFDDDSFLDGGIAAGASGFLLKTTRPAEIAEAIRTIHAGGKVLSPGPTSRVLDRYLQGQSPTAGSIADLDLSDREQQVLRLLCQARTNHQIARQMNVAETTVKTHVSSIMRKLDVGSRLEIVVEAPAQFLAVSQRKALIARGTTTTADTMRITKSRRVPCLCWPPEIQNSRSPK